MSLLLCPNVTCQEAALRHCLTGWSDPIPQIPQTIKEVARDPHQLIYFLSNSHLPGREHPETKLFHVCPKLWDEGMRAVGSGLLLALGWCWTAPSGEGRIIPPTCEPRHGTSLCHVTLCMHSTLNNAEAQDAGIFFSYLRKIKNQNTWSLSTFVGQEESTGSQQSVQAGNVNEVHYLQATSVPSFKLIFYNNYHFHVQARYDLF